MRSRLKSGLVLLLLCMLSACSGGYRAPVVDVEGGPRYWDTGREHKVNRGETLYAIAWMYDLDYRLIAQVNNLQPPYRIRQGDLLLVDVRGVPLNVQQSSVAATATASSGVRVLPTTVGPGITSTPLPQASGPAISSAPLPATSVVTPAPSQQPAVSRPPAAAVSVSSPSPVAAPIPAATGSAPAGSSGNSAVSSWMWPANGPVIARYSASGTENKGIDISGSKGDPVKASAAGEVVYAGRGLLRYGDLIILKHNEQFLSAYAHNDRLLVSEGDNVQQGQVIAEMGSTGIDRVMLHFEIRQSGTPVDPQRYLSSSR